MKQKQYRTSTRVGLISIIIFVALGAALYGIANRNHTDASSSSEEPTGQEDLATSAQPQFSFNASDAPGWRKGPADTTSLALFHDDPSCFVSIAHKTGVIDEAAELQSTLKNLTADKYAVKPVDPVSTMVQTPSGPKQYKLYQYSVAGEGSGGKLYGGQAFGYVSLSDSYLTIQGYCDAADQLPTILPALQTVIFDAA